MDWTYATIPTSENTRVILHREKLRKRHVENPKNPGNEFVHFTDNFGNYAILSNFMTRKVMEQLNLRVTRPYHNVCAMDAREVEVVGIILNLHVKLAKYPDIDMSMDVVVIDVPDNWGMLLSRKWVQRLVGTFKWIGHMLLYLHQKTLG